MSRAVVAGKSYQIRDLAFAGGKLVITVARSGPSPAVHGEPVTIFGDDGICVAQGGRCELEALEAGEYKPFILNYTFDKIT